MKKVWLEVGRRLPLKIVSGMVIVLTGCASLPPLPPVVHDLGPSYHPSNFYRRVETMPVPLKRVAVFPLTSTISSSDMETGLETLEPLLHSELAKTKRFEIVPVFPQQVKQWTGKYEWRADERLPRNLLERVMESTGCDAVLFCQLTRYHPYQPLAVGWKFALVENPRIWPAPPKDTNPEILWSADEVLDAGDPEVSTGARAYYTQHLRNDAASADPGTILMSPTRFGQYTLATLLNTMPERPVQK